MNALTDLIGLPASDLWTIIICLVVGYAVVAGYMNWNAKTKAEQDAATRRNTGGEERQSEPHNQRRPDLGDDHALQWFEVLGVVPSASRDQIKAAYRKKIAEYHPDRVATLGAELRELAEKKSKAINEAFRIASLLRN